LESLTDEAKITDEFYGEHGYETDFNNETGEREFTFVCTNKYNTEEYKIFSVTISAVYFTDNLSDYKIVDFTGAKDNDVYKVREVDDTYSLFGYQTFLVANGADLYNLIPTFTTDDKVGVYAYGQKQASGINNQYFSDGSVLYTAIAEDTRTAANYQVTYLSQKSGARLFVNGPDTREIYFDEIYGDHHDIFIANIGDKKLNNISVELINAQNVKLDNYWTAEDSNDSLEPFTSVDASTTEYGQLNNIAKIRLLQDETGNGGAISGTLIITATDVPPVYIELTGFAGKPKLMTNSITPAVKYVPYSFVFQTDNIHNDKTKPMYNQVTFSVDDIDDLPDGFELFPNGELYGIPKEVGVYTINIKISHSLAEFEDEEVEFILTVLENTDANVDAQNNYPENMIRVQNMTTATYTDQIFEIDHEFINWTGLFFLNGKIMVNKADVADGEPYDYEAEEGSTKITILSQTFENEGTGNHTIAAEFRDENGKGNIMTKGTQNYKVEDPSIDPTDETTDATTNPSDSTDPTDSTNSTDSTGSTDPVNTTTSNNYNNYNPTNPNNTQSTTDNSSNINTNDTTEPTGGSDDSNTTTENNDNFETTTNQNGNDNNNSTTEFSDNSDNSQNSDNSNNNENSNNPGGNNDEDPDSVYYNGNKIPLGGNIVTGMGEPLVIRIITPFEQFLGLLADGVELERGVDYDAREGSTVITIYASTLEKLGEGDHVFTALFDDGKEIEVVVKLSLTDETEKNNPNTGEENPNTGVGIIGIFFLISTLTVSAIVITTLKRRNKLTRKI